MRTFGNPIPACATLFTIVLLGTATSNATAGETAAASPSSIGSGMRVSIDPSTRTFVETPAPEAKRRAVMQRPALVAQLSTVPGGGTMVVLDDRFQSEMRVHAQAGGETGTDCGQAPPR